MNAFAKVGPSVDDADAEQTPETSRPWFTSFDIDLKASTPLNIPANATEDERQAILRGRLDAKETKIKLKWRGSRNAVGYQVQESERDMDLSEPLSTDPASMQWAPWSEVKSSDSRKIGTVKKTYSFDTYGKSLRWRLRLTGSSGKWSRWHYAYVTYGFTWVGSDNFAAIVSNISSTRHQPPNASSVGMDPIRGSS